MVVVCSGAAALSAAIAATKTGASVVILEKAPEAGGTTHKSDGAYWIPNNHHLRAKGIVDPKEDAIRYMIRGAYPILYRKGLPRYGVGTNEFEPMRTVSRATRAAVPSKTWFSRAANRTPRLSAIRAPNRHCNWLLRVRRS